MDDSDPDIVFDEVGHCNHCNRWFREHSKFVKNALTIKHLVKTIKENSTGDYECQLGISGGIDSSFTAKVCLDVGLNPLLFHVDDGWNTEEASTNVRVIAENTGFDLEVVTVDEEVYDVIKSFHYASLKDVEMVSDQAYRTLNYENALKHGVKYLLGGNNWETEGILPKSWGHNSNDIKYLKEVYNIYGSHDLNWLKRNYPIMGFFRLYWLLYTGKIRKVEPLNCRDVHYNRLEAIKTLEDEWGWVDYGGKHHENLYTKFMELYVEPVKFGIDKRKAHLSSLVCSGQLTRGEALRQLTPVTEIGTYQTHDQFEFELGFFLKKMKWSLEEFELIMDLPVASGEGFGSDMWIYDTLKAFRDLVKGLIR
jgi:hypothetical protein